METNNAIIRRLDQLQSHWDGFKVQHPQARICRWLVGDEELSLIDAFFQINAAEESDTEDIFLRFITPFNDPIAFGGELSGELSEQVEGDREALLEEGIEIGWRSDHKEEPKNPAVGFLRNFFHFAISLEMEDDGVVVAFVAPAPLDNRGSWSKWWAHVAELDLPPQIRLMICDTIGSELLGEVAKQYPEKMITIQPPLNSAEVVRELMNEFGDQNDNCTHFRKAFFELTQQVGKQNVGGIQQTAGHALNLARLIGFPHLEVSVLMVAGNGFATAGQLEKGLKTFDEARKIAKIAEPLPLIKELPNLKMDLPGGNIFAQLSVQVLFFKASALIAANRLEQALKTYQEAVTELKIMTSTGQGDEPVDFTKGGIPLFYLTEAHRMSGYCLERLNRPQEALKTYANAVTVAEKMDSEGRKSTMLAFSGQAMLDICRVQGMKQEHQTIFEKMNSLLGEDWQKTLPQKQK